MKRIVRRTLTIVIGLSLGWWAAGAMPWSLTARAEDSAARAHTAYSGAEANSTQGLSAEEQNDRGIEAARALVPAPAQISWYPWILLGIPALFVAALVLGLPALKLAVPPRAESDEDLHDAVGHDHSSSAASH